MGTSLTGVQAVMVFWCVLAIGPRDTGDSLGRSRDLNLAEVHGNRTYLSDIIRERKVTESKRQFQWLRHMPVT
jgi:hypothetical protein